MTYNDQPYVIHPYATPEGQLRFSIVLRYGALSIEELNSLDNDISSLIACSHFTQFDAIEVNACFALDANGQTVPYTKQSSLEAAFGVTEQDNVACWTVYGHLKTGGTEALLDFPTEFQALSAASILEQFVGRDIWQR